MNTAVDADYLVVGAGATGMAFVDALLDHADRDLRVALVDRRHGAGGHWLAAYPFVRLHQASAFYGVGGRLLGGGRLQRRGPEKGLQERADQPTICAYYAELLEERRAAGQVEFHGGCDYLGDGSFRSHLTGETFEVGPRCRIVDARYLAPDIPAEMPRRFAVEPGARVIPVNDLVRVEDAPSQYVVVGSGKTATDAVVWLLGNGVDPDAICWIRPRDPWMLNRGLIQPDPAIFLGMAATLFEESAAAESLTDLFHRLEEADIMHRIDRSVEPTMARAPTLGAWELDLLRMVENVVRLGHIRSAGRGRIDLVGGTIRVADDALVVDCAAEGLKMPPLIPVWQPEVITPQPIRAGFPCFGAALTGYVEATRFDAAADDRGDAEKNRVCAPSPYANTMADWARMNVVGTRNAQAFGAEPDIKSWADGVALNPARIAPGTPSSPALDDALERLARATAPGLARLDELA
ncbi:NAD(P)/FAD-dependent oxidoreductase [Nocardioides sp. GY 10113]|uniref:NAD(P)-binding protein n=1 Tax=Nocardioides sp. GY 10113 TaxID=2569761 RepID=UPI0010A790E2|nr:FAD/NAD(P)-binding protein [Nocardioides sp. GY 10113]TIC85121.1 NAD(P)/FAD-dependent oxidoreductase [Nocardioides sp. GY 10113]